MSSAPGGQYRLEEIKIEVTYECSLNCIHCSSDAMPTSTLALKEATCLRILDEAAAMGVREVAFSGGEPLLWESIYRAVETARDGGLDVSIYTAGIIDDVAQSMKRLRRAGASKCIFSFFAASQQGHERITRLGGSFDRSQEAAKAAVAEGIRTELHFVPMSSNYRELPGVAELGGILGTSSVSVLRFVPQGRGRLLAGRILDRRQNLELRHMITRLRSAGFEIRTGSPYNFLMLNDQPKCNAAVDRLIVGPDTAIYPCDAFKQVSSSELVGTTTLSRLADASLEDCWRDSPYLNAVRDYLTTPFEMPCVSCEELERCLSGCLAQKVLAHGSLKKVKDPACLRDRARRRP